LKGLKTAVRAATPWSDVEQRRVRPLCGTGTAQRAIPARKNNFDKRRPEDILEMIGF
jgi:rubredoxin